MLQNDHFVMKILQQALNKNPCMVSEQGGGDLLQKILKQIVVEKDIYKGISLHFSIPNPFMDCISKFEELGISIYKVNDKICLLSIFMDLPKLKDTLHAPTEKNKEQVSILNILGQAVFDIINQPFKRKTQMREKMISPELKYRYLGENRRKKLISLVVQQGMAIRKASKKLKINESTAKSIIKLYNTTGKYTNRPRITRNGKVNIKVEAASQPEILSELNSPNQTKRVPTTSIGPQEVFQSLLNISFQFPGFSQTVFFQQSPQQLLLKSYNMFIQAMMIIQATAQANTPQKADHLVKKQEFQRSHI